MRSDPKTGTVGHSEIMINAGLCNALLLSTWMGAPQGGHGPEVDVAAPLGIEALHGRQTPTMGRLPELSRESLLRSHCTVGRRLAESG
jgi:hypothetical protein